MLALDIERLPGPIGEMILLTDALGRARALDWTDHEARMMRLLRSHNAAESIETTARSAPTPARRAIEAYFDGDLTAIDGIAIETGGTDFRRAVWRALRAIPAGTTMTYGGLARLLGMPRAVRAVGAANGANPISIVVPCHRLIGAGGSLTGYGGGIERKRWLLRHEGVA